jgi:DNA gyrase subunit A
MRGRFTIDIDKKGKETIIFTEIPYQVNKANLITRIGELVRDKGIDGIANINDFSDRNGMKISIELKRGAIAKIVLNQLFTKTALQSTFGVINLALVKGRPETLTLKQLIQYFVEHRQEVVTRRTAFDLRKAEERAHILRGLIKAIQNIDEVIKIIKASRNIETAKNALKERFDFSDIQAQAIVDMRLGRLTSLEIEKLEKELEELEVLIAHLQDLLAHPEKILALIKDETNEIAEKFGDDRKTDIISDEVEEINIEDLIKNEEMVILISNLGYIKRVPVTAYRTQGRGGKGSASTKLVEDDFINQVFIASTHDHIMFITNEGKLYWVKVHEIPEATRNSRGSHIKSLLPMSQNEEITTVVSLTEFSEDQFLFMATAGGIVKKVRTIDFQNAKTRGIIAIRLDEGDKLVSSILSSGEDELVLITRRGQALRVSETEVRPMGRASRGVIGIRLAQGDELAGAIHVEDDAKMLILTEFGCGKQVEFSEFTPHGRGTGGQRIYRISEKTGEIVGTKTIGLGAELVVITSQGKTLRLDSANIPTQGRTAAGVCVFTLDKPDMVIGVDVVAQEE